MAVVDLGQVVFKFSDLTPEEKAELKGATGIRYGVCSTSGSNKSKNVNISSFSLEVGAGVNINFLNANTGTEPTLNISSTGAYPIVVGTDSIEPDMIEANHIYTFVFDGTYWQMTSGAGAKNPVVLTQE